jgi:predicted transcriptional regulator
LQSSLSIASKSRRTYSKNRSKLEIALRIITFIGENSHGVGITEIARNTNLAHKDLSIRLAPLLYNSIVITSENHYQKLNHKVKEKYTLNHRGYEFLKKAEEFRKLCDQYDIPI